MTFAPMIRPKPTKAAIVILAVGVAAAGWQYFHRPRWVPPLVTAALQDRQTMRLRTDHAMAIVAGDGDQVEGAAEGHSVFYLGGEFGSARNATLILHAGHNVIDLVPPVKPPRGKPASWDFQLPSGIRIIGFNPASDRLRLPASAEMQSVQVYRAHSPADVWAHHNDLSEAQTRTKTAGKGRAAASPIPVRVLSPGADGLVDAGALDFTVAATVLDVGPVGGGTAVEVAAAMTRVYRPAGREGRADAATPAAATGESLTVIGTTAAGDTVVYDWAKRGITTWSLPGTQITQHRATAFYAPTTPGQPIGAESLHPLATLTGVPSAALTAADFE